MAELGGGGEQRCRAARREDQHQDRMGTFAVERGSWAGLGQQFSLIQSAFVANLLCAGSHVGHWESRMSKVRCGVSWERAQPREGEAM